LRKYSSKITLTQTSRGVWGLDTVKGCKYGTVSNKNGCYGICYACSVANRYGYDFSNSTIRRFESKSHINDTVEKICMIKSDFIRIGIMGDPSECWGHTIDICDKIKSSGKKIVIITKHWEPLPDYLYEKVKELGLIINTSVSAIDEPELLKHRLNEYENLKEICTSVLRVVSCDFNTDSIYGIIYSDIQDSLFKNKNVIDTIMRPGHDNQLVTNGVINVENKKFMKSNTLASIKNKQTHFGNCEACIDKCGANFLNYST